MKYYSLSTQTVKMILFLAILFDGGGVVQWVECLTCNRLVVSSSLIIGSPCFFEQETTIIA